MDEVNFIQDKYSKEELKEFEKNQDILNEHEEKLRLELQRIAELEEKKREAETQAQAQAEAQAAQNEEPQPVLSLGGPGVSSPSVDAAPVTSHVEESISNKTESNNKTPKKQPKKKSEVNTDL